LRVDVADSVAVNDAVKSAIAEFGPVEVAVLNAGVTRDGLAMRMSDDQWREVLSTDLDGAFYGARATMASMVRQRAGSIIFIGSISPFVGVPARRTTPPPRPASSDWPGRSPRGRLARHHRERGRPGLIETDMTNDLGAAKDAMAALIPMDRIGQRVISQGLSASSPVARPATSPAPSSRLTAASPWACE